MRDAQPITALLRPFQQLGYARATVIYWFGKSLVDLSVLNTRISSFWTMFAARRFKENVFHMLLYHDISILYIIIKNENRLQAKVKISQCQKIVYPRA